MSNAMKTDANVSTGILVCATALTAAFFMPWVNLAGFGPSGYGIQDFFKGEALLLWAMPVLGVATLFLRSVPESQRGVAQMAGASPFLALGYGLHLLGEELMQVLSVGAYVALAAGLSLFLLARRIK